MSNLYAAAAVAAIALAPALAFRPWNGAARILRRRAARLTILPVLAALAGCDAGGLLIAQEAGAGGEPTTSSTASGTCSLAACPAGSFTSCEATDTMTPCCQGGAPTAVCARPAGILVHSPACDAVCSTQECAEAPSGALACCTFTDDGGAGPCDVAVDGGGK